MEREKFLEGLEQFKAFYQTNPDFPQPQKTKLNIFIHFPEEYLKIKDILLASNFEVRPAEWCSSGEGYIDFELDFGPFELSVSVAKAAFGPPAIQTVTSEVKKYLIPEEILQRAKPEDRDSLTRAL
jgi:hypothetical protein